MPKPIFGDNGSGMHVHSSLWKDGEPLFYDEAGYGGLSDLARWYIGGILEPTRPSLLAFTNPSVNSYHRLVPGFEAPVNLVYGRATAPRACGSRSPVPTRRPSASSSACPDPSSNPYLAFAAMLHGRHRRHPEQDRAAGPDRQGPLRAAARGARQRAAPSRTASARSSTRLEADHDFLTAGDVFTPT